MIGDAAIQEAVVGVLIQEAGVQLAVPVMEARAEDLVHGLFDHDHDQNLLVQHQGLALDLEQLHLFPRRGV